MTVLFPANLLQMSELGFSHMKAISLPSVQEMISGNINSSSRAILFEIPKSPPLSILQYRHANLNNYLHGPSYALETPMPLPRLLGIDPGAS